MAQIYDAGEIFEMAQTNQLMKRPLNRYTQGLLKTIIPIDKSIRRLNTIRGQVPSLSHLPNGCTFQNRCDFAVGLCHEKISLKKINKNHLYRCANPAASG